VRGVSKKKWGVVDRSRGKNIPKPVAFKKEKPQALADPLGERVLAKNLNDHYALRAGG